MHISKKFLIIGGVCVLALAATIGGVTAANAADNGAIPAPEQAFTTMMDKVAEIYEQNTGTAIDSAELQKAFEQAGASLVSDKMDAVLNNLVADGKLTQEQADQWKTWWESRPSTALSGEFKTWMESRPDIPNMPGLRGDFGGRMNGIGRAFFSGNIPCLN
jgi:hypothetical protein